MISLGIHDVVLESRASPQSAIAKPSSVQLHLLGERLQGIMGARLRVQEPIALGGMATIFRLQHVQNGGLYVAKILHEELCKRPEVVESFRREALHAAQVGGHPNAIPVFDSGMSGGLFFITMPFVEGEDLDKVLDRHGPFSREETLHAMSQISSLLCHAESHGITHCDLAPGNIRLDLLDDTVLWTSVSRITDNKVASDPSAERPSIAVRNSSWARCLMAAQTCIPLA